MFGLSGFASLGLQSVSAVVDWFALVVKCALVCLLVWIVFTYGLFPAKQPHFLHLAPIISSTLEKSLHLSTSLHHPPLSASPRCSHYFPSISSRFVYHRLPSKFVFIPLFILFFFLPDLLLSSPPVLYSLAYFFFSNPRRVSQLKALSSSYRPVVSLCTIRSALALGFCNSLTSSLPFLSSLCGFFSPPRFVSFIFSPDLCTEVFAL